MDEIDRKRIEDLKYLQNMVRLEISHRAITGLPMDCKEMSDEELAEYDQWYSKRIDEILAPYESESE